MKITKEPAELICFSCKHFDLEGDRPGCKAFPDGIPLEITEGLDLHKRPLKGQGNDLVFTPR